MDKENLGWLERQDSLIGEENSAKLQKSSVMIFGVGGVGSFVAEACRDGGYEG